MKKIIFILTVSLFCFPFEALAIGASLYLAPSTGTYTVGNTFSVQVRVNTGGVAVNAVDGSLVFNPDKLEVASIRKDESVFNLWVQEPSYSNALGSISFGGGRPTPGYTGSSGTIVTITFRAKTATLDTANVTFAGGSALADDGKGTNILTNMGSGAYRLVARETGPLEEPVYTPPETPAISVPSNAPAAPEVVSSTHPDPEQWYAKSSPEFSWKIPAGVTGVSFLLTEKSSSNPGSNSDGMIESKSYENLKDGIWYFHIKFQNQYGWGAITHRKVMIDTQPPGEFQVTVDNYNDLTNPSPVFRFFSQDAVSGIDRYEISVDNQRTTSTKENSYIPPPIEPGSFKAEVRAFDKANNFSFSSVNFEIKPIPGIPELTKVPESIRIGEMLVIEGKTLPDLSAVIYLQKGKDSPIAIEVKPDSQGKFSLNYDRVLIDGTYSVWARSKDERGALSLPSKVYPLKVGLPPFLRFGKIALDYLTTMATIILLIIGLLAVLIYFWYAVERWKKRLRKETKEVSQSVTAAFRALSQEVEEQIEKLDAKPGLTKSEKELKEKLQEALDISERFIGKEMEDVDKELE